MNGISFTSTLFSTTDYDAPMKTFVYGYDCDMYVIRRDSIDDYRKTLSTKTKSGVYCLIGEDGHMPCIYIGQAGIRMNSGGIIDRICEHNRPAENYWHTAFVFSMRNDDFEPTELNYMENNLTKKAEDGHRYKVINKIMPSTGYMRYYDEMSNRLDRFLNMGILIMNSTTPYRVFNVKNMKISTQDINADTLPHVDAKYKKQHVHKVFTINNGMANCIIESENHVTLLRGSVIRKNTSTLSHDRIERIRMPHKESISSKGILLRDIDFNSLSGAADFVMGYFCNGHKCWKDNNGKTYREVSPSR